MIQSHMSLKTDLGSVVFDNILYDVFQLAFVAKWVLFCYTDNGCQVFKQCQERIRISV